MQAISCDCAPQAPETFTGIAATDRLHWDGAWPGERDAVAFGWSVKASPQGGWTPCRASDPKARPDLNRLRVEASWDLQRKQFVKKARSPKASKSQQLEKST